ncbi:MAG: hypothetical protein J4F98_15930, partial [Acidobacteria bacterium]|nr:hypothetical protein [Acidobacteriota bacterium]
MDFVGGVAQFLDVVVEAEVVEFVPAGGDQVESSTAGVGGDAGGDFHPDGDASAALGGAGAPAGLRRHQHDGLGVGIGAGDCSHDVVCGRVDAASVADHGDFGADGVQQGVGVHRCDLEDRNLDWVERALGVSHDGVTVGIAHDHDDSGG